MSKLYTIFFNKNLGMSQRYTIKMINKKRSFSLAEVLVTLTIIGVVAGMTIPPLVQSYQKQEYVTRLKKAYTTTNQALQQMATDMGCTGDLACTGLFDSSYSGNIHALFGDEFVKYFNVAKNCQTNLFSGCIPASTNDNYDGTSSTVYTDNGAGYRFTTTDGISMYIFNFKNDCKTSTWSTGKTGNMAQTCAQIYIDINGGAKKPNCYGRDVFIFAITNGKGPLLYPRGGMDDKYGGGGSYWWKTPTPNRCSSNDHQGYYCAGRVLEEGWEMNY